MGPSTYIGRVGALAVALGIGTAVAAAPAWAEPTDTDTTTSSESTSAQDGAETSSGPDPAESADPTGTPDPTEADDPLDAAKPSDGPAADEPVSRSDRLDEEPARTTKRRTSARTPSTVSTEHVTQPSPTSAPDLERQVSDQPVSMAEPQQAEVTPVPVSTSATESVAPAPVPEVAATTGADTAVAVELATAGPTALPGGDVPVQTPAEWTLLAAARREIGIDSHEDATPATQDTTAQLLATAVTNAPPLPGEPTMATNAQTGIVTGKLTATDPEKRKLTYTLIGTAPEGLVFNAKKATFTYTPTTAQRVLAGLSSDPTYVSFTVAVSDSANTVNTTVHVPVAAIPITDSGVIDTGTDGVGVVASNTRAYVSNTDNTITVIDTVNRTVLGPITLDSPAVSMALTPDGKKLYVATAETQSITVINTATNAIGAPIKLTDRWADIITVSPDGKTLYAATARDVNGQWVPTVTKISTATGKITGTLTLTGAVDTFYSLVVTPDSKRVYVIADLQSEEEVPPSGLFTFTSTGKTATLVDNGAYFTEAVISPDGKRLYVNDVDAGTVVIYDTVNHQVLDTFANPGGWLGSLVLTGDGSVLLAVDTENNALVAYETRSGDFNLLSSIPTGVTTEGYWPGATLSPDGKELLYVADDGAVQSISLVPTGTTRAITAPVLGVTNPTTGAVTGSVTAAAPGQKLGYALVGTAPAGLVFNAKSGTFTYTPSTAQRILAGINGPTSVSFTVTVTAGKNTVPVQVTVPIDPVTPSTLGTLPVGNDGFGLAVTNNRAYISRSDTGQIVVIDTIGNEVLNPIDVGGQIAGLAVTPDGKKLYVADIDGKSVAVIDTATGAITKSVALSGKTPSTVTISPDGKTVYVATHAVDADGNPLPATITKIATKNDKVSGTVTNVGTEPTSIVVSPNGKKVYVVSAGAVYTFSSTAKKGTAVTGLATEATAVAVSTDGTRVFVAGADSMVYVVNAKTNVAAGGVDIGLAATALKVNKDGSLLLAQAANGNIAVLDATTLFAYGVVNGGDTGASPLNALALSPDGMQVYALNNAGLQAISLVPPNALPTVDEVTFNPVNTVTGAVTGNLVVGDPDNDKLTLTATKPAYGTVVVKADGSFTYTPTAAARHNAAGTGPTTDSFVITIDDARRGIITQTIEVDILPANVVPTVKKSQGKPNSSTGVVKGGVTVSDKDKDALSYTVTAVSTGTVTVTTKGAFTYTPTPEARHAAAGTGPKTETFTITVNDGHGGVVDAEFTVNITPVNAKPTVKAGAPQTDNDTGVVTVGLTVSDADGDTVTFTDNSTTKGSYTVDGNVLTYTPTQAARDAAAVPGASNAIKTDTLTVAYTDGHGVAGTLTVRVDVSPTPPQPANRNPVAGDVSNLSVDLVTGIVTGSVSASDPDNDTLTFSGPTTTTHGTVDVTPAGVFTYQPTPQAREAAAAGGPTEDSFTVTITDGRGGTATKLVEVDITPAATPNTGQPVPGTPLGIPISGANGYTYQFVAQQNQSAVIIVGPHGVQTVSDLIQGQPSADVLQKTKGRADGGIGLLVTDVNPDDGSTISRLVNVAADGTVTVVIPDVTGLTFWASDGTVYVVTPKTKTILVGEESQTKASFEVERLGTGGALSTHEYDVDSGQYAVAVDDPVVSENGTLYVAFNNLTVAGEDPDFFLQSHAAVLVVPTSGASTVHSVTELTGESSSLPLTMKINADGTVFLAAQTSATSTAVLVLTASGAEERVTLAGTFDDLAAGSDFALVSWTPVGGEEQLSVIGASGLLSTQPLPVPVADFVFGADGGAYAATTSGVVYVSPAGVISSITLDAQNGIVVGPDGAAYLLDASGSALTVLQAGVPNTHQLDGTVSALTTDLKFASDGTAFVLTRNGTDITVTVPAAGVATPALAFTGSQLQFTVVEDIAVLAGETADGVRVLAIDADGTVVADYTVPTAEGTAAPLSATAAGGSVYIAVLGADDNGDPVSSVLAIAGTTADERFSAPGQIAGFAIAGDSLLTVAIVAGDTVTIHTAPLPAPVNL